jgi:hypothetical protein
MDTIGKLLMGLALALMLGFGAGEVLGPQPAAAMADGCQYQICSVGGAGYACVATVMETNCAFPAGPQCQTAACQGGGCDPEEPDCQDPPD